MTIDIFQTLGAATEQISFGELYVALQQGVVDGQENPLVKHSLVQAVRGEQVHLAHRPQVGVLALLMSQITWTRLTPADRDIIKGAAKEAGDLQRKLFQDNQQKAAADFKANPKLEINQATAPRCAKPVRRSMTSGRRNASATSWTGSSSRREADRMAAAIEAGWRASAIRGRTASTASSHGSAKPLSSS